MLKFQISNQHINRVDDFEPVSDSVGYLKASFEFLTEDWNDTTKTVIFRTSSGSYPIILDESNICEVDSRALVKGSDSFVLVGVSVFGVRGKDYRITTTEKIIKVMSSGYGESGEMPEPPEDVYAQIIDLFKQTSGDYAKLSGLLAEGLAEKMSLPTNSPGSEGQFLTTNGNGLYTWKDLMLGLNLGVNGQAFGSESVAGCKGYYWKNINTSKKIIVLNDSEDKNPFLISSTPTKDSSFPTPQYNVGDWFYIVNGNQHIVSIATITKIENNLIYYDNDLGITEVKTGNHFFCVPSKPTIGLVNIFGNMTAFGSTIAAGEKAFSAGEGGIAINYGAVFGKNGIAGNSAFVGGIGNKGLGTVSAVFGEGNTAYDWGTFISGQGNNGRGINNLIGGALHNINGNCNVIGGQNNNLEGNYNGIPGGADNHFKGDNSVILGFANNGKKSNGDKTLRAIIAGAYNYGQFDDIVVIGNNLVAGSNGQIVLGKWNVPNGKALIIGCGESGARKNALEVDNNGNVKFSGTVRDGNGNSFANNIIVDITIPKYESIGNGWGHILGDMNDDGSSSITFSYDTTISLNKIVDEDYIPLLQFKKIYGIRPSLFNYVDCFVTNVVVASNGTGSTVTIHFEFSDEAKKLINKDMAVKVQLVTTV